MQHFLSLVVADWQMSKLLIVEIQMIIKLHWTTSLQLLQYKVQQLHLYTFRNLHNDWLGLKFESKYEYEDSLDVCLELNWTIIALTLGSQMGQTK